MSVSWKIDSQASAVLEDVYLPRYMLIIDMITPKHGPLPHTVYLHANDVPEVKWNINIKVSFATEQTTRVYGLK